MAVLKFENHKDKKYLGSRILGTPSLTSETIKPQRVKNFRAQTVSYKPRQMRYVLPHCSRCHCVAIPVMRGGRGSV